MSTTITTTTAPVKQPVKPLDVWTNDLITDVFFQPDDELAIRAFEERIAEDCRIEVNGSPLPRSAYLALVRSYRAQNIGTDLGNPTLCMHLTSQELQTGTVAQCGRFMTKNKETGREERAVGVTIIKVEEVGGRRRMVSLVEVQAQE